MTATVLVYAPRVGPNPLEGRNVSGHAQLPARFAAELAARGWDVTLATTADVSVREGAELGAGPNLVRLLSLPDYKPFRPEAGASDVEVAQLRLIARGLSAFVRELRSFARESPEPAVVHLFASSAALALLPVFRSTFRRSTIVLSLTQAATPRAVKVLGPLLVRMVDVATAPSVYTADLVEQHVRGLRAQVIRPGIPINAEPTILGFAERDKVSFIRFLTHLGGGDIAAKVMLGLEDLEGAKPFIAVRPHEDELQGVRAQLEEKFEYHVFPSGPNVDDVIRQSRCLVQPFRRATVDPQLSVLEAMRAGTPVIVSNVGPLPELVDDERLVFSLDDYEGMGRVAARLCREPLFFAEMSEHAQIAAQRYSWQKFTAAMISLYERNVRS